MKRGLLLNLGLSLSVSVVFALVLEGVARLVERPRPPRPEVADYIWDWDDKMPGGFYVMRSDAVGWPPWEEFNGDGLRDRTRPREKADRVRRVAILGDSVTLGAEIRPHEAYPRVLEDRLREQGSPVEVMSVALWGWSTRQERIAWQRIASRYGPDAVVLAVCLNDIPELHNNLSRPPRWLTELHVRSALVRLLVGAEGREIDNVERLFAEPDSARVREALERFFEEVRALRHEVEAAGASFSVIVFPFRFQVEAAAPAPVVQRRIAEFCRADGLRCLDLLPAIERLGTGAFVDYDHLSPEGSRLTADALLGSGLLPEAPPARAVLAPVLRAAGDRGASQAAAWLESGATGALGAGGVEALVAQLEAADAELRLATAWALARTAADAPAVADGLARRLRDDTSSAVRAAAAGALGRLRARSQAPALFDALADAAEAVRFEAARALAALEPGAQDVPSLTGALASPDDFVAAFAAWALGNVGEPARPAVPALARALDRERIDTVVAGALARIGRASADAVPALVEMLGSSDAGRRWRAARTLGRIGTPAVAAVPALLATLQDENALVRLHAARAVGRVRPPDRRAAGAALQRATGDGDEAVRREAREALERLQGKGE